LRSLAANLDFDGGDAATSKRRTALAKTLDEIADRLR
jgi:hypothetical protein